VTWACWTRTGSLTIVGPPKDLVISGGLNLYPREVEDVLDALVGVAESAVVGLPDQDLGEALVAVVVAAAGPQVRSADRARTVPRVVRRLEGPERVVLVGVLPRNAIGQVGKVGKVDKNQLRARLASR